MLQMRERVVLFKGVSEVGLETTQRGVRLCIAFIYGEIGTTMTSHTSETPAKASYKDATRNEPATSEPEQEAAEEEKVSTRD
jgi:hypothetical protein